MADLGAFLTWAILLSFLAGVLGLLYGLLAWLVRGVKWAAWSTAVGLQAAIEGRRPSELP